MAAADAPLVRIEWIAGSSPAVVVTGEIDVVTAPTLAKMLAVALACGERPVQLDLSEAALVDASILGVIATADAGSRGASGPAIEITGASGLVARVFEIAGMTHLLEGTPEPAHTGVVLVVDDDESVRTTMCEVLESAGYGIAKAADGEQALALMGSDVGAMVLDLQMPKLDGMAVLEALPELPPVIVLSAFTLRSRDLVVTRYGGRVAAFLQKPVPPLVLLDTVKECLGKSA